MLEVNGHDVEQISDAVEFAFSMKGKPTVIVADTVKGKGVTLLENNVNFHGSQPKAEEWSDCYAQLDAKIAELEGVKMGENISTRVAYSKALAEFGTDEKLFVFDADLKKCTMTLYFAKEVSGEIF